MLVLFVFGKNYFSYEILHGRYDRYMLTKDKIYNAIVCKCSTLHSVYINLILLYNLIIYRYVHVKLIWADGPSVYVMITVMWSCDPVFTL